MAVVARYLIDTSAASRMTSADVSSVVGPLIANGLVATAAPLDFEALWSARSSAEYEQLWQDRKIAYEYLPTNDEHWQTALDTQRALAQNGTLRAVKLVDLLVAALAEDHNVTVLHYDSDFEIVAQVLDFSHQWVVPRGTLS